MRNHKVWIVCVSVELVGRVRITERIFVHEKAARLPVIVNRDALDISLEIVGEVFFGFAWPKGTSYVTVTKKVMGHSGVDLNGIL